MAEKKDEKVIDLREKVTMYAPAKSKVEGVKLYHSEGEKIQIAPALVDKFTRLGYTKTQK
jgi:hypothetical protein